jgi:hypothetical protein
VIQGKAKYYRSNHASLSLRQNENGPVLTGMAFGLAESFSRVKKGPFDIAFSLKESWKNGTSQIELVVKGIRQR